MFWLFRSLKKLVEDGATPSLLLKIQSLPCRSGGLGALRLAAFEPGEELVGIYACCRYGPVWAQWRVISGASEDSGNKATLDLGLDETLKITSLTGNSHNEYGFTSMLKVELSDGTSWGPHGNTRPGTN